MELELNQAPDVNLSFVSETNEIILQLLEAPEINIEFTGVVYGEKGPAGEGIENFETDLDLLYQIAKL